MCTDFIILKGLYVKKKTNKEKKTRKRIHKSIERITHSLTYLWYSTDPGRPISYFKVDPMSADV